MPLDAHKVESFFRSTTDDAAVEISHAKGANRLKVLWWDTLKAQPIGNKNKYAVAPRILTLAFTPLRRIEEVIRVIEQDVAFKFFIDGVFYLVHTIRIIVIDGIALEQQMHRL